MKKMLCLLAVSMYIVSCGDASKKSESTASAPPAADSVELPYKIDQPDNWEHGSISNVAMAMNALKAIQSKDIDGAAQYFADTIHLALDNFDERVSRDTMKAMLGRDLSAVKQIDIAMNDWETVISHDKKDEYVSLWYKQTTTMNDGKVDSVICMDDVKINNGKITVWEEKIRRLPAKK